MKCAAAVGSDMADVRDSKTYSESSDCLVFRETTASYYNALSKCNTNGGKLVQIVSDAMNSWVEDWLDEPDASKC